MTDPRSWEFGQLPLIVGPLIGLRAFRLTADGLTGVHKQVLWANGENTAECLATFAEHATWLGYGYGYPTSPPSEWTTHAEPAPVKDCSCGFFAYFDGTNTYMNTTRVCGLIEGYGHLIVGSRGFRAEKARIVALIAPAEMTDEEEFEWRSVVLAYPDAEVFPDLDAALAKFPLTPVDLKAVEAVEKQAS